jgi:hypothetical protein
LTIAVSIFVFFSQEISFFVGTTLCNLFKRVEGACYLGFTLFWGDKKAPFLAKILLAVLSKK